MKIEIKKQYYKQLVQCAYLGNLVFNEYRVNGEELKDYASFCDDILMQIVKAYPRKDTRFSYINFPNEKSEDTMLSDLYDGVESSVKDYYEEYRYNVFCEILADKLADANFSVKPNGEGANENLLAKTMYFKVLKDNEGVLQVYVAQIDLRIKKIIDSLK